MPSPRFSRTARHGVPSEFNITPRLGRCAKSQLECPIRLNPDRAAPELVGNRRNMSHEVATHFPQLHHDRCGKRGQNHLLGQTALHARRARHNLGADLGDVELLREQCRTAQGQKWLTEAEKNLTVENSSATSPASPAREWETGDGGR
jgi:hypothetical protein